MQVVRVLVDTDLVLEALLNRNGVAEDSEILWETMRSGHVQGHVTEICLNTVRSYVSKLENTEIAEQVASQIQDIFQICTVNRHLLEIARSLNLIDFESAVEVACAVENNLGAIVTHNPQNFAKSSFTILSINELLKRQDLTTLLEDYSCQSSFLSFKELDPEQARIDLHSKLIVMIARHVLPSQSQLKFSAQYKLKLIEEFLREFYAESLKAFRQENELEADYTPYTQLEQAKYMAFTEQYAKRHIIEANHRSQQLIVLMARNFAKRLDLSER